MAASSPTDISVAHLRALVAIAEAGTFTAAARALGLTQSGVSHTLAALEDALGVTLLVRGRTGATPTAVGERVLADARDVLLRIDTMRQHAGEAAGLQTGRLRVASVPSAAVRLLPPILRSFRRRHPGIEIVLLEGTDEEVAGWVRERLADVGIAGAEGPDLTGLQTVTAAEDQVLLIVPKGHALAARDSVKLGELRTEQLLLSAGGCEPFIRSVFARARVRPMPRMAVRDIATLVALVRDGFGVTLVPEFALPPGSGIKTLRLDPPVFRRLVLVTPSAGPASPALRAFLTEALRGAAAAPQSQIHPKRR